MKSTPLKQTLDLFSVAQPPVSDTTEPSLPEYDTPVNAHSNIMIIPNFISPDICKVITNYANNKPTVDLGVFDGETTNTTGQ